MAKIINQGQLAWLVTRNDDGSITWAINAQLPDNAAPFIVARGTSQNLRIANSTIASEAVALIVKRRS